MKNPVQIRNTALGIMQGANVEKIRRFLTLISAMSRIRGRRLASEEE